MTLSIDREGKSISSKKIRRAAKRSNERQNRKISETAKQARNKGFWKAIKTITSYTRLSSGSHLQITLKSQNCSVNDHETV